MKKERKERKAEGRQEVWASNGDPREEKQKKGKRRVGRGA